MSTDIHTIFSTGDCPSHEDLLAYFKGVLTGEEKHRIEHHLMECEMCSDELGGLSKMKDVEMLPQIVEGIRSEVLSQRKKIILMNPRILMTAAAAAVVLLIGALFLFRIIPSKEPEKISTRQNKEPMTLETESPVPPAASRVAPSPPPASAGKPLLAVLQPLKKKEVKKDEDETIAVEMKFADQEPVPAKFPEKPEAPPALQKDTMRLGQPAATASGAVVESANYKSVGHPPASMAEEMTGKRQMSEKSASSGRDFDRAMDLYQNEDYRQASVLFEKRLDADSSNSADRYYLAGCRYYLKDYVKAKQLLQKIVNDPEDPFYLRATRLLTKVEGKIK